MIDMSKLNPAEERFARNALEWRLLRRVWQAIAPERRERFKELLEALVKMDDELRTITPFFGTHEIPVHFVGEELSERNETFEADESLPWDMQRSDMWTVWPGEYLKAIACWEEGREYVRPE